MGGGVVVQGHGVRERQLWGPRESGGRPELTSLLVRRYRCRRCGAVSTVGPAELLTRRLYSAAAIAYALALFAVLKLSPRAVRARISPFAVVGVTSASRWLTLLRWCSAMAEGRLFRRVGPLPRTWSSRRVAERAAMTLASYALPSPEPPPLEALAYLGAARAR